jgi:hypothetical protein
MFPIMYEGDKPIFADKNGNIPNYDPRTQIFYGVIGQNDDNLNQDAIQDIFMDSLDLIYEEKIKEIEDQIFELDNNCKDKNEAFNYLYYISKDIIGQHSLKFSWEKDNLEKYKELFRLYRQNKILDIRDFLIEEFNNSYQSDNASDHLYQDYEGYKILFTESELMILKSSYYTFAPECSPCFPYAGDLGSINPNKKYIKKTYCLDKEFYEDDKQPQYKIYKIEDDSEVN